MRWISALLFGLCAEAVCQQAVYLPRNEQEAAGMLADGSLDSATWMRVRPFYDQPLMVAEGELRYLGDLFPEIGRGLPVAGSQLAKYEPWDEPRIRRFFADHPELVPFQPVLDFSSNSAAHIGTVSLRIRQRPPGDTVAVLSRFDLDAGRRLGAQGSAEIGGDEARWHRRAVTSSIPVAGEVTAGNYSLRCAEGLVGGYFGTGSGGGDDMAANWLYGDSRSWNGVKLQTPLPGRADLTAFVHARPSEKMAGVQAAVALRGIEGTAGVSVMSWSADSSTGTDTAVNVHWGMAARRGPWNAGWYAALDARSAASVPVVVCGGHEAGGSKLDVRFIRIPAGFRSPCSGLQRSLSWRLTHGEGEIADNMTEIGMEVTQRAAPWATVSSALSYVTDEERSRLDASLCAWGMAVIDYRVRYLWQPSSGAFPARHTGIVSAGCQFKRWYLSLAGRIAGEPEDAWISSLVSATADWSAAPCLHLSPLVSASSGTGRRPTYTGGMRQTIDLFEKTRGELQIEAPVSGEWNSGLLVNAAMTFYF